MTQAEAKPRDDAPLDGLRRLTFDQRDDRRHIATGSEIPTEFYSDQPYLVQTDDNAWLCIVTTGTGREGQHGQHVVSLRSTDQGRTWTKPVALEPVKDGPENSYAVLLKTPAGRIYAFYNHNTDNVRRVQGDPAVFPDGYCYRVDSLGHFVFKYSDDHGCTWSEKRYPIDVREMAIDRENADGGRLRYFWNVGRPIVRDGAAYVSLHKVGGFGAGFFTRVEGVLLKSDNLLTESDPEKITWETLPDGEHGIRTPPGGGPIASEQSYSVMSDGSIYCVFRTVDGHPGETYSRDGGHTFAPSAYKQYAEGRPMKHPRAANFTWRLNNGNYLYWFHNHGGCDYEDRNPVWVSGGIEADGPEGKVIRWTEPEILLYDDDPYIRMSYPDLIEEDGKVFISETQKFAARVHEVDPRLLDALWGQFDRAETVTDGLILDACQPDAGLSGSVPLPMLPPFTIRDNQRADYGRKDLRQGFTIDLWFTCPAAWPAGPQTILDTRTDAEQGIALLLTPAGVLEFVMNDGRTENRWRSDVDVLQCGRRHHVAVIIDGGPKLISYVIDGKFNDGGVQRQFGWGRFSPNVYHVNGAERLQLAPDFSGRLERVRLYDRSLLTSEAISNYRADAQ